MRVRPSRSEPILALISARTELTRSQVAEALNISYFSARYWLDKLADEKLIRKEIRQRGNLRRIFYYSIIPLIGEVYYRTQYALMFYTEKPRTKTPDPIAEFRVTGVSERRVKYSIDEFKAVVIHVGIILAPQTWWIKQQIKVTAYELDEPIDKDELHHSVRIYGKLNYCERNAVFFKSRIKEGMWRAEENNLYWWLGERIRLPAPRMGDYLYAEEFIKDVENRKAALGALKKKFNNELGVLEVV